LAIFGSANKIFIIVAKVEAAHLSLTANISRSNFSSCYIKNPIFDFDGDYPCCAHAILSIQQNIE